MALSEQQAHALDRGDAALLIRLSELRGKAVSDSAAYLPPVTPWDPELAELVEQARERAEGLQQSIRACMATVRRDLATLTHHQRARRLLDR